MAAQFRVRRALAAMAGVSLAVAGCTTSGGDDGESPSPQNSPTTEATQGGGGEGQTDGAASLLAGLPDVVERVEPSVVTVLTNGGGLGSGVVFEEGGWVLTNHHVVAGQQGSTVQEEVVLALADGRRVPAQVVATDEVTDLAILQAEGTDLPVAEFRTGLPQAGEMVVALGSPLGFRNSVTMGIVSGLGREVPGSAGTNPALVDLIQTDAAISPGNSGGALVDAEGKVVGINDAYIPPQQGAVSIGFAIPSATALDVAADLRDDGRVTHPVAGLVVGRLTPQIAQALDVPTERGVVVRDVVSDGPAADAGLEPGDVIVSYAGEEIATVEDLLGAQRGTEPGQSVDLTYLRGGEEHQVSLELESAER
ncbi:hypothetical protein GCM10023169_01090 [Georgenia halophila]|uniref:PDZ domain-containing protein n=1 Tax=Georgenia halophila TaxID=620889 RepID=A0ABP8KTS4_9MICO